MGGSLPSGSEWGSFEEQELKPSLGGVEIFGTKVGSPRIAALSLTGNNWRNPNFTYRRHDIYFPHVAKNTQLFWTGIAFVNTTQIPAPVVALAYDERGQVLAQRDITMQPDEKWVGLAYQLFPSLDPSAQIAWIHLQTDGQVQGYELFGDNSGGNKTLAGFPAVRGGGTQLLFQKLTNQPDALWTGIAAVNLSSNAVAQLTYRLYARDGSLLQTATGRTIEPLRKEVALASSIFGGSIPAEAAWIELDSTQPLAAFQLFGDLDNNYLAGTLAVPKAQ